MFFGDNAGGDQYAVVHLPQRDDVFVRDHETDSRLVITGGPRPYLDRILREPGGDWWR
ncbi:hypothetical protein [Streptomyces tropicalis]|uniref:Uncharacterized protein n=1 Tax=Streptomyces tropicalis TaxID=3034234 RepID=A0ABT5ZZU5_9ACTN|nr:hypothetical protein [Streptomyces tropicalis]MDF3297896.1 hypothetical protein [Streptomyces tropicalis]